MENIDTTKQAPDTREFSFVWNGGFSYLTYLKKKSTVIISEQHLQINTQNFYLGVIPARPRTTELSFHNVREVALASEINWFDLVFSILFLIATLITMKFWFLVLTAIFLLCTFNTSVRITDSLGNRIRILSGSKDAANQFAQKLTLATNQRFETAAASEVKSHSPIVQPITVTKESNKKKTVFWVASAALVALSILFVGIYSRGGFDNKYVNWVREGNVPGSSLTMKQVLENSKYFSNIEWSQVAQNGHKNDVNKYVMYQGTYSDQGVKVAVQTIFQVFGENHFQAVETSANGDQLNLPDWQDFLVEQTYRYGKPADPKAAPATVSSKTALKEAPPQQTTKQPESPQATTSKNQTGASKDVSLQSFKKWSPSDADLTLPLKLDGENMSFRIGRDTPNGVKVQISNQDRAWNLRLPSGESGASPFDSSGELKKGFGLYVKDHNFDAEPTPEVVVGASDGLLETYVWVFSFNFLYGESKTAPLELIWYGEGQSDVILDGNKILLPYGSKGLYEEYVYSNLTFEKTKK